MTTETFLQESFERKSLVLLSLHAWSNMREKCRKIRYTFFFCLTGCFWYHFSLRIQDCATLCRSNSIHKLKVVLKKLRFKLFASSYYHGNTFCIHVDVFNFPLSIFAFVGISYGKKLTIFLLIRQQGRRDYWMACDVRLKQDTFFWMETFHKSWNFF